MELADKKWFDVVIRLPEIDPLDGNIYRYRISQSHRLRALSYGLKRLASELGRGKRVTEFHVSVRTIPT